MSHPKSVSLRQYVLPYYNYTRETRGWQFGMPPRDVDLANDEFSVLAVQDDGKFFRAGEFSLTRPEETDRGQCPRPHWLWIPVREEDQTRFARVVPPRDGQGSVPLSEFEATNRDRMYAPEGLQAAGHPQTAPDIPFSMDVGRSGDFEVSIGGIILADGHAKNGRLHWIQPAKPAYKLNLWTSHLSRLAWLQVLNPQF